MTSLKLTVNSPLTGLLELLLMAECSWLYSLNSIFFCYILLLFKSYTLFSYIITLFLHLLTILSSIFTIIYSHIYLFILTSLSIPYLIYLSFITYIITLSRHQGY